METFQWSSNYETGLAPVDEQHRYLVQLINRFSAQIEEGQEPVRADLLILHEELSDYAQYHFLEERQMMEALALDPRHQVAHLQAHDTFIQDLNDFQARQDQELVEEIRHVLRFTIHWLAYHILGTDQEMARQVSAIQRGLSPSEAYADSRAVTHAAMTPLLCSLDGLFALITERNRHITALNRELEAKVEARTQALSIANQELAEANACLETMAMTDLLTGLFNRRYAMSRLEAEISSAQRHQESLALVMIDADGLKAINDTHGHDAGDDVIEGLAAALKQQFRASDVVCRLGGDEFLVICPRLDAEGALQVAERVRQAIQELRIAAGSGIWSGSISAGVAGLSQGLDTAHALIKAADAAVYESKRQGRNRVSLPPPEEKSS